ncbi:MAG: hypothetical protein RIB32_02225 [Phycisphaerales bacterium]
MRKNVLLTLWLIFPLAVMGGLVWVIVATVGAPKKMDVPAVGPGAGDTGGANALGEWLAGNNPNEVDPAKWPGGVEIRVPVAAFDAPPTLAPEGEEDAHTWVPIVRDGMYAWTLKPYDVRVSDAFVLRAGDDVRRITLPPTDPAGAARNEPIVVTVDPG